MEVKREDVETFAKQIHAGPPLWNAIRIDGNCFFHALEYAAYQRLLSKTSPKTIEFRQNIVSTMNKPIVSGVPYNTFMHGTKYTYGTKSTHGTKWAYAELDVVVAAAKYIKRTIIVISISENGGVTMIRPKVSIGNPVFLICDHALHYIPFEKIKLTEKMKQRLKGFEKTKIKEHIDGAVVTTFLLSDLYQTHVNSVLLTRKRLQRKSKTHKYPERKQENANHSMAKKLQKQYPENANYSFARRLQIAEDASYARLQI
jgi:hypothetical protein